MPTINILRSAGLPLNDFIYEGDGYTFQFKDQNKAFHTSIVVAPHHLKVLTNDTEYSEEELLSVIILDWFAAENVRTRQNKIAKRKQRAENKCVK